MLYQRLILVIALFSINSCGFKPVYQSHVGSIEKLLDNIEIEPIDSVDGANFYNHLSNLFPSAKTYKYILTCDISFSKGISVIQSNSDVLRENTTLQVKYHLNDKNTDKIISSGNFSRMISFNTASSPYSNLVIKEDMQKNLAIMAAEEVRTRLLLSLNNQPET